MIIARMSGARVVRGARVPVVLGLLLLTACGGKDSSVQEGAGPAGANLSWPAVPGASSYTVFVFEPPAKPPVWMWDGASTSVRYGESIISGVPLPELPPSKAAGVKARSSAKPLSDNADYGVVAFNSAGGIIAVHERRRVQ